MRTLAGVIVLYNPVIQDIKDNINSYIDDLNVLYCIDNSSENQLAVKQIISELSSKIQYLSNNGNIGLSRALRQGCRLAEKAGYSHVLLLDQDSYFDTDALHTMRKYIEKSCEYALYAPCIKTIYRNAEGARIFSDEIYYGILGNGISSIKYAITSGSVVNLKIYGMTGKFDKKLFIGQIDNDYCCRLQKLGYKIARINEAYMYQELGNTKIVKLGKRKLHIPNLNPSRYYYLFRNERYLRKKNGKSYSDYQVKLYKYLISILFFEKEKIKKLYCCLRGWMTRL